MKALILAFAAGATAAAPAKQQFDLACTAAGADTANGAYQARDVRLRVDLQAGKWCEDPPASVKATPCAQLNPIVEVQPGAIWFEKQEPDEKLRGLLHWRAVNRETGAYHQVHDMLIGDTSIHVAIVSQCEAVPFSGFPKVKTKF